MAKTKKKQSAKQKRILIASIIIAAAITVGGTFAWFTSSDTVTNRLTASADYGVSITEDFTPPEDWTPGQTVNKEVAAINTGNVSAFVKLSLTNAIEVTYEEADTTTTGIPTDLTNYVKLARESSLAASTDTNPTITLDTGAYGTDPANEVASVQAGGMLVGVYTSNAWVTNLTTKVGTQTVDSTGNDDGAIDTTTEDVTLGKINSSSFTPSATGVYIFRREITAATATTAESYTYSGYYYDATSKNYYKLADDSIKVDGTNAPTFDRSEDKLTKPGQFTFSLVTKTTDSSTTPTFKWEYYNSSDKTYKTLDDDSTLTSYNCIRATYSRTDEDDDDIVLHILLDDTFNYNANNNYYTGTYWTAEKTLASFYLNKVLEPGETSNDLVESITLDSNIDEDAYTNLIYDLNVALNSVQVIYDDDGTILAQTTDNKTQTALNAQVGSANTFGLQASSVDSNGNVTWQTIGTVG